MTEPTPEAFSATETRRPTATGPRTIKPCNFRSAGRLSNESSRALGTLQETLARNLMNSLDVYLGTGLDVKFISLDQLTMEAYRSTTASSGYILPFSVRPSLSSVLLDIDSALTFTMVDLLLGGSGGSIETARELTDIDEEIMNGTARLIAQQVERSWQHASISLVPGSSIKASMAHKAFLPTEKVLRTRFDVTLADMTGTLHMSFPSSLGSTLVRNIKADLSNIKGSVRFLPRLSLQERLLDCPFMLGGVLPYLRASVRDLAAIEPGSVLKLSASIGSAGHLTLEEKPLYEATPVRQSNKKAFQLLDPVPLSEWMQD